MTLAPRVVLIHRRTELEELVDRHGTRGQVEFFLRTRGRDLAEVQRRHDALEVARRAVQAAIPADWRTGAVERADLSRFLFEPADIVIALGEDGLVANVAKYLDHQPVVGVDPEPGTGPGVLVPHRADDVRSVLVHVAAGTARTVPRTMVACELDDGQQLTALNEIYLGHPSHQSARYRLALPDGRGERQSSSGLLVGTGTGATGWCASVVRERGLHFVLPAPSEPRLAWFVREAWPSPLTGTDCTAGVLDDDQQLEVVVATDALVVFGDGIEADRLSPTWGQRVVLRRADRVLQHVAADDVPAGTSSGRPSRRVRRRGVPA
jgi:NAD kinase